MSDAPIEVSPADVRDRLAAGDAQVVDVREQYEWDAGHLPQTRHVELATLPAEQGTIDRDRPVVFLCRSGVRSLMAAQLFRTAGYDAYSMTGGLLAWEQAGLEIDGDIAAH